MTATQSDVIKGKTAYLQGQDDPLPGMLELTGNATDIYVYPGKTYYSTNPKVKRTGTMPTQAARTITPGASAQTVAAGRYLDGAITVPGFALPAANTIKKGTIINIYGRTVTGTFEGYVPTATDLYLRGNNIAGFTMGSNCTLESGGLKVTGANFSRFSITSAGNINYAPYNYLNIEGYFEKRMKYLGKESNVVLNFFAQEYGKTTIIAQSKTALPGNNSNFTRSIDIRNVALSKRCTITLQIDGEYYYDGNDGEYWSNFTSSGWQGYVYRIWLS